MRQIDQEIIEATDELKNDVALTTEIVTGNENTEVEVAPGNTVRSPKKMIEDCYRETQQAIEQQFGSLDKAVDDATSAANRADSASQSSSGSAGDSAASSAAAKNSADTATEQAASAAASASAARESEQAALQFSEQTSADAGATADHEASAATWGERAEQQAKAAAQSSTTASSQATMAKAWAANPEDARVDGERYSSLHYASKSSEYADASSGNAELSRDQSMLAQQAMRNASNSEINANLSKVQAQQAATEAGQSKEASGVSEQKAADYAAAAKNSETVAVGASDSALDSKNSAAGSAGTATQQADRSESEADRSEAAADKINREGIPIGSIVPYYGSSAPMGWLGLTKGAKIRKADYPALYKHLTDQRKPPHYTNVAYTLSDGKWLGANSSYLVVGNSVACLETINGDRSNHATLVSIPVHTSGDPFPSSGTATIYGSLVDIPLPNEECFLPDAANNFIKGYEPSGEREMGTFEQDVIRNITADHGSGGDFGFDVFDKNCSGANYTNDNSHTGWRTNTVSGQPLGNGKRNWINFDASRVVPTGPENVPKNLNCLWIIKAYDAVNDPEQLQAKVVVDQVNSNTSEILTVNGAMSQFGYELLDFGLVTKNSRYVKSNPFGNNTPVIVRADIYLNDQWSDASFLFSSTGMAGANYNEGEGIVLQTSGSDVSVNSNNTGDDHNYSFTKEIVSVPCRVHVWRVKG